MEQKANKESVMQALKTRISHKELKSLIEKHSEIEKELMLKANIKDLLPLLDEKASM